MNPDDLVLFVEYSLGCRILDQLHVVSLATGCLSEFKWWARLDQEGDLKSFSVMDDHPELGGVVVCHRTKEPSPGGCEARHGSGEKL